MGIFPEGCRSQDAGRPLVIGVSGHRILMETERIVTGIALGLRHVAKARPERPLHLLSGLADGADRLAARHVLGLQGGQLLVALPLPRAAYLRDFATPDSLREFDVLLGCASQVTELRHQGNSDQAYAALGNYIVEHSDVLLAIWDGQGPQGRGGTGEVVGMARQRNLPLVWVHAGNRKPGTHEPSSLGAEQGQVSFERI